MALPPADDPRAALIARIREVAARLGVDRLTLARFCAEAGVSMSCVARRGGSWRALCDAAGLVPTAFRTRVPDEAVFAAMRDCFNAAGGITTRVAFERASPWSDNLVARRWGTWRTALAAFRDWAAEHAPDFPHREALESALAGPAIRAGSRRAAASGTPRPPWPARAGAHHSGPPLGFRAMIHAPANELGVVLLFGMVAGDLGYAVDAVAAGYPDCAARRIVSAKGGAAGKDMHWQAVKLEFEYRSRAFRDHRHDPDGCDVVVCWEHDWPDCPLEVLELKSAIAGLAG